MLICQPGDILVYYRNPSVIDRGIQLAEEIEDGPQPRFYYHVAIALDANRKLEAYRRVGIHPIEYNDTFDVFRPPIAHRRRDNALQFVRSFVGQRYDYILILDDALRYLTHGHVHLPVRYVKSLERHMKVCSSLLVRYLLKAMWGPKLGRNASPEDVYLAVKDYGVRD